METKQKAVFVDYRTQLKECEGSEAILAILQLAKEQWEAVGGTVETWCNADESMAHLIVSGVTPEIVALVHETSDQCPDISYVTRGEDETDEASQAKQLIIQTMKEELIECIGGPDIEDTEVEALYEILAGNKEH